MNELEKTRAHAALVKTRGLIEDPKDWSGKGWGKLGGPRCLLHAMADATGDTTGPDFTVAAVALYGVTSHARLGEFNDSHPHAEVLGAVDRAIASVAPEPDVSFLTEQPETQPVA